MPDVAKCFFKDRYLKYRSLKTGYLAILGDLQGTLDVQVVLGAQAALEGLEVNYFRFNKMNGWSNLVRHRAATSDIGVQISYRSLKFGVQ